MIDEEKLELYDRIQRRLTSMITGKDWDDESIVNFLNDFKEFKYHPITVADYQEYKRDVIEFNRSFYEPVVQEETVEEKREKEEELFERILKRTTPLFYDKIDEWSVAFLNEFEEFKENPITMSDYQKFKVWVGQVGQVKKGRIEDRINDDLFNNEFEHRYGFSSYDLDFTRFLNERQFKNTPEYSVYIHILPNNTIYIGQTKQKPENRWKYGEGYSENKFFYNLIKKYGWSNIDHILYKENLTKMEADTIEKDLIAFYSRNERITGRVVLNIQYNNKLAAQDEVVLVKNTGEKKEVEIMVDDKVKQIIDFIERNPNKSNNWYATHNGVVGRSTYFNYLKDGKLTS